MKTVTTTPRTERAARGYTRSAPPRDGLSGATKRAVIYLRVSTAQQAGTDRGTEGFSIPAQREACLRKAQDLGATVVDEYVDKGESARQVDRPALQDMLARLAELRDVDFVIVHKVDRLARNRADDVQIDIDIRTAGAQLVSVTENIDASPSGTLVRGIMSSIAEFYSMNLSAEVTKGMSQKVRGGGLSGKAPIGYRNVREIVDGREIRTIALDPERAGLIAWAFEAYATGEYGLIRLAEELTTKGLRYPATAQLPERPLHYNRVHEILHSRFYAGIVTWAGVEYPGSHEPLVSVETFAKVQALLRERRQGQGKERKHRHYLKGLLLCGRCHSRLGFSRSRGNGGEYDYFFCLGRHTRRTNCNLPHLSAEDIEDEVERYYGQVRLGSEAISFLRTHLFTAMKAHSAASERAAKRLRKRIDQLEAERRKLLETHLSVGVPLDLLQEQQNRLGNELDAATASLASTQVNWSDVEGNLNRALELINDPPATFKRAKTYAQKRGFNLALFEAIYIDTGRVADAQLGQPFEALRGSELSRAADRYLKDPKNFSIGRGLKESTLVGGRGFEPLTPSVSKKITRSRTSSSEPSKRR